MQIKHVCILGFLFGSILVNGCKEKEVSKNKEMAPKVGDTLIHTTPKEEIDLSGHDEDVLKGEEKPDEKVVPKVENNKMPEVPQPNPTQEDSRPAPKPEKIESMDPTRWEEAKKSSKPEPEQTKAKKANASLYQQLLSKYVTTSGKVRYRELKSDMAQLEAYTMALADDPTFISGTRDEKLALWINTYNAYTLLMVIKHYPIYSIRSIYEGKPWDVEWIRIGKKTYSLNQIENDIIRPQFSEPRIHFVLNCAAISCPPLNREVITAQNLETILERSTKNFINGKSNLLQENTIFISSIFDWYRADFGDVLSFIKKYADKGINPGVKIQYLPYDWNLNKE